MNNTSNYNLNIPELTDYFNVNTWNSNMNTIDSAMATIDSGKVDKVAGKGLSSNDYTTNDKNIVSNISSALEGKVDKVTGKVLSSNDYTNNDKSIVSGVTSALANKVDVVSGKGLSTNDYTDEDKDIVSGVTSELDNKVDKVTGKGLSTNDFTNADKNKLDGIIEITQSTITDWGFYTKPSSGIPASDLASNVIPSSLPASDVSAWAKANTKPTYTATEVGALADTTTHLSGDIAVTEKGANNGVATLGSDGKIPSSQLPSYVDDVLEYSSLSAFPATGESGKIYIATDTNKSYRWSGTTYVEISSSIVIGTTAGTALDGGTGQSHINNTSNPHNVTKTQIGLGNVTNDKQITGNASGTTEGNIALWGADGFTLTDSGFTIEKSVPSDAVFTDTIYTLPKATTSTLGGVKVDGSTIVADNGIISTVNTGNMNKTTYDSNNDGVVNAADTLDGLIASITELNYLDGVSSNVQGQLDNKLNTSDVRNDLTSTSTSKALSAKQGKTLKDLIDAIKDGVTIDSFGDVELELQDKVAKVTGKGLSTNDFTTNEKDKLTGIEAGANNYSLPTASVSTIGGVKIDGTSITINDGVISCNVAGGTSTLYTQYRPATNLTVGMGWIGGDFN